MKQTGLKRMFFCLLMTVALLGSTIRVSAEEEQQKENSWRYEGGKAGRYSGNI